LALQRVHDLEAIQEEWGMLAAHSPSPFASWEWNSVWWRHFGKDRPLHVFACRRRSGELAAILPLYLASRLPLRVLRFLGHGPGDELSPICAPDDREAAAAALRTVLDDHVAGWDLLLAERMPAGEGWDRLLGAGHTLRRESSPVLPTRGRTWDDYLAERSRNFREQARRLERKLAREHDLSYRMTTEGAQLEDDVSTLFRLHETRWRERGSGALGGERAVFHREFAAHALARGWLRLLFLEIDGQPAAAWYGLRYAGADWFYQAGRDPGWDRYSHGWVLLLHTVRATFDDGMREYRLLRGDEEYKARLAEEDPGVVTSVLARTLRGHAAAHAGELGLRLPRGLKRSAAKLAGGR
jgi:CelD/BcsL family acetyltransferase involved in cellulose biosynthesis